MARGDLIGLLITGPSVSGLVRCVWLDECMLDVVMFCICL
jgi:hypothetical protein